MARTRYTKGDLKARVEKINRWLDELTSTIRFEVGGRNGYTAVDQYSIHADGSRIGSGCDRNVGCGTPRECAEYAEDAYSTEYRILNGRETAALRAENNRLKETVARLEGS
jgi:hypothetical protein